MKILFVVPSFRNGGTNTSLRNMVSVLHNDHLQLYVFAITDEGPNKAFLTQYCTLLNPSGSQSTNKNKKNLVISYLSRCVKWVKKKLEKIGVDISPVIFKRVAKGLQKQNFDLVIAFQESAATQFCSFFDNTRTIAWVRCDYSRYLTSPKIVTRASRFYSGYEKVICVSEYTCQQLLSVLPGLKTKIIPLHNLINDALIIERSKEKVNIPWDKDTFSIVSVGRFDRVKRFEYIPQIASVIKSVVDDFKWIIIGDGKDDVKQDIIEGVSKYDVIDNIILLGEINNPYPYIANSNLVACISSTEACPNVVNEAKILHVPVAAANFGSVYEFIEDNYNGVISPIEKLGGRITELITNKEKYNTLKNNISSFKYDNDAIVAQLKNDILKIEQYDI